MSLLDLCLVMYSSFTKVAQFCSQNTFCCSSSGFHLSILYRDYNFAGTDSVTYFDYNSHLKFGKLNVCEIYIS